MRGNYKINYWNPLLWIITILIIPVSLLICPFIEETVQATIKNQYDFIKKGRIQSPKKIWVKLLIFREYEKTN